MEIHIRLGKSEELPDLITLQSHSLKTLCAQDYTPEQLTVLLEDQAKARRMMDEILFVAEVEQQIVGFASLLKPTIYHTHTESSIGAIYVDPDWVRRGIASQLLARLENTAVQTQIHTLQVMASLTAVPFYRSQNYQSKQATGFWIQDQVWIPCQLLEKSLVSPQSHPPMFNWVCTNALNPTVRILLALLGLSYLLTFCHAQQRSDRETGDRPRTTPIERR
jgi:putative acetyltransferase